MCCSARGRWEHPANHRGTKATGTLIAAVIFSKEQLYLVNPGVHRFDVIAGEEGKKKREKLRNKKQIAGCRVLVH